MVSRSGSMARSAWRRVDPRMTRFDPNRGQRAAYPIFYPIAPRFADLDPLRHINNVAMATILEDARVRFVSSTGLRTHAKSLRLLIASVRIDYLAEAHYPETIDVGLATGVIGRKSWTVASAAFQKDLCVAVSNSVVVFMDGHRPVDISEPIRDILENFMVRQALPAESTNSDVT
jgi:acyl-CoA thioester hydrolase